MARITESRGREATLSDVLERIRAEHFPHIDREIVRELLRLHADPTDDLARRVDELIFERTEK